MLNLRTKRNESSEKAFQDRWLISYADLMTLLLALFIVLYAAADKERAKQIVDSFSAQNISGSGILPGQSSDKEVPHSFEKSLLENPVLIKNTKMRQTGEGLIVSLSEAGFFAPGEAEIGVEAENVIATLADNLKTTEYKIRVEGHTDSLPISNARYPSNWELSTARASSVLILLSEKGIAPERLSAAGYGGFQPIADNSTPEGRTQNRRVDVVILNRNR
jgi:chemotaxis protein MotB